MRGTSFYLRRIHLVLARRVCRELPVVVALLDFVLVGHFVAAKLARLLVDRVILCLVVLVDLLVVHLLRLVAGLVVVDYYLEVVLHCCLHRFLHHLEVPVRVGWCQGSWPSGPSSTVPTLVVGAVDIGPCFLLVVEAGLRLGSLALVVLAVPVLLGLGVELLALGVWLPLD
jgi:hypothetical protein